MKKIRELFCRNLTSLREAKDLSQRALSLKCGFAHSYVGQLERGSKDPSFESLLQLADKLDVSIVDFFRNHDDHVSEDLKEVLLTITKPNEDILQSLSVLSSHVESELRMAGVFDSSGKILDVNRTVLEILHEGESELFGREVWDISVFGDHDENRDWIQDRIRRMGDSPKIYRRDVPLLTNDDAVIDSEVSLTPLQVGGTDETFILAEAHRLEDIETDENSH